MSKEKNKELLFSVTANDCDFKPYRGSGAGGQKKNKTESAMRCTHRDSGAVGECEEYREQGRNKKEAFKRMASTLTFQNWLHLQSLKALGTLKEIENYVDQQMKKVKIEFKDEDGRWVDEQTRKETE